MQRRHLMQAGAALAVTPWFSAQAETYPERPIRMLQGFAPGGNADNIARVIGIEIGKTLAIIVAVPTS